MTKQYQYRCNPSLRTAQRQAKELWRLLFDEPFPKDWKIWFGVDGVTYLEAKEVHIAAHDPYEGLRTVIHEFVHVKYPKLQHNQRFAMIEKRLLTKATTGDHKRGGR